MGLIGDVEAEVSERASNRKKKKRGKSESKREREGKVIVGLDSDRVGELFAYRDFPGVWDEGPTFYPSFICSTYPDDGNYKGSRSAAFVSLPPVSHSHQPFLFLVRALLVEKFLISF